MHWRKEEILTDSLHTLLEERWIKEMSNRVSVISVEEARRILGSDGEEFSEEEIEEIIRSLNTLARGFVSMVLNGDAYAVFMEYNKSKVN